MTSIERCLSCGAAIRWGKWLASGRWCPVDVEPREDGNVVLVRVQGRDWLVSFDANDPDHRALRRYASHFASCPNADKHRKGRA